VDLSQRLSPALVPDALTTIAFVHAHGVPGARIEDCLHDTGPRATSPAVWLDRLRSRLGLCVHGHLEYRSSRLTVSRKNTALCVPTVSLEALSRRRGKEERPAAWAVSAAGLAALVCWRNGSTDHTQACAGGLNSSLLNSDGLAVFSGRNVDGQ
jgi:hypothetical protein